MNGYHGTFELVNPDLLVIDKRYQRDRKNTLIQQIAQSPSWEAFGVPICFKRDNNMYYVADGQQRVAGLLKSEDPPRLIPIVWFPMEGVEEEAQTFVRINEWRKSLQPLEKHKGKVQANDPAALAIERAVGRAGFSIGTGQALSESPRTIQAIAGVGVIYNRIGEDGLTQTLTVIREAWPDDGTAISTHMLRGVADLIEEQGESYNRSKMISALRKTTPAKLLRKADELRFDFGGSLLTNMRRAFAVEAGIKMPKGQQLPTRKRSAV